MSCRKRSNSRGTTTRHVVRFAGRCLEATVTNDAATADDWVESVLSLTDTPMIIGLDTEWQFNFVCERRQKKVAVLQLCAGDSCLVLQLCHTEGGSPAGIVRFLKRNDVTFVGVGVKQDVDMLRDGHGIYCCNYEDLEGPCWDYIELVGSYLASRRMPLGLKGYAREVLGIEMEKPKSITLSDWGASTLSNEQIEYACIDAYVSYALGAEVCDQIAAKATEVCDQIAAKATY